MTLTYGLGYALEMPPTEQNGKQTVVVDQSNTPVSALAYLDNRRKAALQGQVYNPELGFALVGNAAGGLKYPYNPFYGEFSPRVAFAWSPRATTGALANTVVRAGYGRQYGRTNGVDQVLVPLLGLGLTEAEICASNVGGTTGSWGCAPSGAATWNSGANAAFRVCLPGVGFGCPSGSPYGSNVALNSLATATLPQPVYPGFNNPASASPEGLDPNFRPNAIDSFNVTVQHQLNRQMTLELGYIGRRITHEYLPLQLNAVPYMMTLGPQGGQQFKQAYANTVLQYCGGFAGMAGGRCAGSASSVTPQSFFETALAGTGYCTPFLLSNPTGPCTAAVVANEGGNLANQQVWSLWSDLDSGVGCPGGPGTCTVVNGSSGGAFAFPRSMMNTPIPAAISPTYGAGGAYTSTVGLEGSVGYGNYNAGFVSLKMADWRGLTMQSNFTWSKALGTGAQGQASSELTALDPFNLNLEYGVQQFDRRLTYNAYLIYQPPFYKGQQGLMGRLLGGWTFATIFTAGTGSPVQLFTTEQSFQTFGACDGISCAPYSVENAVPMNGQTHHTKAYYCSAAEQLGGTTYYAAACPGQVAGSGPPVNYFANGANDISNWRNPILGVDTRDGGGGVFTGLNYWNMDFSIKKSVRLAESVTLEFQGVFANALNHNQWQDNSPCLCSPANFGALGADNTTYAVNGESEPRNIEIGARVRF